MSPPRRLPLCTLAALVLVALLPAVAAAKPAAPRYALANGCYALRSQALGKLVAKDGGGGYAATPPSPGGAEPLRVKATALGSYLLYGRDKDFLAGSPSNEVQVALDPSELGNWQVDGTGPFTLTLPAA